MESPPVKRCVTCDRELPASSDECVFCGEFSTPASDVIPAQGLQLSIAPIAENSLSEPVEALYSDQEAVPRALPPAHAATEPVSAAVPMDLAAAAADAQSFGTQPHREATGPIPAPPYLASQTERRAARPVDPWAPALLRKIMLVCAAALTLAFFAPWSVSREQVRLSWSYPEATWIILVITAGIAIAGALIPLSSFRRSLVCLAVGALGLFPMGIHTGSSREFLWLLLCAVSGGALLLRSKYRSALWPRVIATAASALVVVSYWTSPSVLDEMSRSVAVPGAINLLHGLLLYPMLLALLSLLAWLPAPSRGASDVLAWGWLLWPLVAGAVAWAATISAGEVLGHHLGSVLWIRFASAAWLTLAAIGTANVTGKWIEHGAEDR